MNFLFTFSGSGLRYPFHAGILSAFENRYSRQKHNFAYIGCSGGAIVSLLASHGFTGEDIYSQTLEKIADNYEAIFESPIIDREGINPKGIKKLINLEIIDILQALLPGGRERLLDEIIERLSDKSLLGNKVNIRTLLRDMINDQQIEETSLYVLSDMDRGVPYYVHGLGRQALGFDPLESTLASIAIPGVYPHQMINGTYYADGGLTDRLGLGGVDEAINLLGWEGQENYLIICDARPARDSITNPESSLGNLNRAYQIATDQSLDYNSENFKRIRYIQADRSISTAFDISREAIENNFLIGLQLASREMI